MADDPKQVSPHPALAFLAIVLLGTGAWLRYGSWAAFVVAGAVSLLVIGLHALASALLKRIDK